MLARPLMAAAAAVFMLGAAPLAAADLGYGSPYDDPRYADLYGDDAPPPPRHAYRDRPYLDPAPRPRFADRDDGCVPRRAIRDRLVADGWRDFDGLEIQGPSAVITARRPDGRPFRLRIDRCSGEIVRARPVDDYAHSAPRYDRTDRWRSRRDFY